MADRLLMSKDAKGPKNFPLDTSVEMFVLSEEGAYPLNLRIFVRNELSPLKVRLDFQKSDLVVCYSQKHPRPTEGACEKVLYNPESLVLYATDEEGIRMKAFTSEYYYISLQSEEGTLVKIHASAAPPPQEIVKSFNELTALLPKEGAENMHRSAKSRMI